MPSLAYASGQCAHWPEARERGLSFIIRRSPKAATWAEPGAYHCWPAYNAKRERRIGQTALSRLISWKIIVAALSAFAASQQSTSR